VVLFSFSHSFCGMVTAAAAAAAAAASDASPRLDMDWFFLLLILSYRGSASLGIFWGGGDSLRKRDIGAPITAAARPRRSSTCRVWQPSQRADRTPRWSRRSSSGLSSSCSWSQEGPRSGIDRLESPAAGRRLLAY